MEKQFPLLYLCAVTLLACDGNSTCENERAHSPAGRITEPYRASMKPAKVEQLTLAYFMIRKRAEADTRKQMEAWAKASLDQRAAEEELLAMKVLEAEWAMEAQWASDSDDDLVLMPDPKRARGGEGGGGCVTCHLRNRSTRASLTFPIVTCHLQRRAGEEEEEK